MRHLILSLMLFGCSPEPVDTAVDEPECQNRVGYTACDFSSTDQNGDTWTLYEQKGKVVVLDISAMWCPPCQAAAIDITPMVDFYGEDRLEYVTILIEDVEGDTVEVDDAAIWAQNFGLRNSTVLADNRDNTLSPNGEGNPDGFYFQNLPNFWVIDENSTVLTFIPGYYGPVVVDIAVWSALYH